MNARKLSLFMLGLALAAPAASHAQAPAPPTPVASAQQAPVGPSVSSARVAAHRDAAPMTRATAVRAGMGQSKALMIVGGAAVVAGIIIGGDVGLLFTVGGAVAGLLGLYQYLQ